MRLFPSCREVSGAIASGEYDDAPLPWRLRLMAHLLICDLCRAFLAQLRHMGVAAKRLRAERLDPDRFELFKKALVTRLSQ